MTRGLVIPVRRSCFFGVKAFIIGLSTASAHEKRADAGYVALGGLGPSATSFADVVMRALGH